ncbi:unnamed protein product [Adineta steineri]|uniref:Uncharacterized protein n=1 Tax=Adineta steineri TaxID=433720 RepID=A0A819DVH1_9BILA|nr:unnamed protein product [Adineta steineri]CAF3839877.1 unnamed protein product [Adineta steineri]
MKRSITTLQISNNANVKANLTLEGIVVAVTPIFNSQFNKQGKYWTGLVCDSNQDINRITKYLSSKTNCLLHTKMIEFLNNQNGMKLNELKFNDDNMYTATNQTIVAPKLVSFTPSCIQLFTINDIESMSGGQYVSFICKIIDWSSKVKIFNNEASITTTTHTTFESVEDIGDINCSDTVLLSTESIIIGMITSIGLVEETFNCPKCYSTNIERNNKTIKCNTCQSRSLFINSSMNQNQIKLNITDLNQNTFELIVDTSKIKSLLQECNHQEVSIQDLIEQESVLLILSSITIHVNFNPINKHITNIVINTDDK